MKKLTLEKEALECQLKNEKDEKELYKVMPLTTSHTSLLVTQMQEHCALTVYAVYARAVMYLKNGTSLLYIINILRNYFTNIETKYFY